MPQELPSTLHRKKNQGKNEEQTVLSDTGGKSFFLFKEAISFMCHFRVICKLILILVTLFFTSQKSVSWLNFKLLLTGFLFPNQCTIVSPILFIARYFCSVPINYCPYSNIAVFKLQLVPQLEVKQIAVSHPQCF